MDVVSVFLRNLKMWFPFNQVWDRTGAPEPAIVEVEAESPRAQPLSQLQ